MANRILITVDTEALPARAQDAHVERLIWGRFQEGEAGIRQFVSLSDELEIPFLFFLDMAGAITEPKSYREVASYLIRARQDVQMHFHPEVLGKQFWRNCGVSLDSMRQDLFDDLQARTTLQTGMKAFRDICGYQPTAYRAGSFRWNASTLKAMADLGIEVSFNCCRETSGKPNYDTVASTESAPFRWRNGVIEVPCGETIVDGEIVHLRYPRRLPQGVRFIDVMRKIARETSPNAVINVLLHSWSFLERDKESGYYRYADSSKLDSFYSCMREAANEFTFVGYEALRDELKSRSLDVKSVQGLSERKKNRLSAVRETDPPGELFAAESVGASGQKSTIEAWICKIPGTKRCEFAEDFQSNDPEIGREVIVRDRKKPRLYVSKDEGRAWNVVDLGAWLDAPVERIKTLRDGRRIVQAGAPPVTYCLDRDWNLLFAQCVGRYRWHATNSIDEGADGTVMFAEYRGTNSDESRPEILCVWRLRPGAERWEPVLKQLAHSKRTDGYIRHFHTCMADPYLEGRWYVSSGDLGKQNRFWVSDDSGESWREIEPRCETGRIPCGDEVRLLRFTSAVIERDWIYWATDDDVGIGKSVFVRMDRKHPEEPLEVLCEFDCNLMRSLTKVREGLYFAISEAKHDTDDAHSFLVTDQGDIVGRFDFPNMKGEKCPVTLSLGSPRALNGVAFYPALGRILSDRNGCILAVRYDVEVGETFRERPI